MSSLQMAHFVRSGVSPYTEKVLVSSATNPFEGAPAAEVAAGDREGVAVGNQFGFEGVSSATYVH